MTLDPIASQSATSPALLDALRRGDYTAGERLLELAPLSPEQLGTTADGLMRRRRWREAEWLFARLTTRDVATEMKRCLAGNLAALQAHRREVYAQLILLPSTDAFGIAPSPSGRPTILARREDGTVLNLSGGPDPLAAANHTRDQLRQATPNGESVALCGFGDGYILQQLADSPPKLFMDMEQAVFVFEPEPQVVLHGMMIHDLARPDGPIVAERFRWFVGPGWTSSLNDAIEEHPTIGIPTVMIQQGFGSAAVQSHIHSQLAALGTRDAAAKAEIEAYYAAFTPELLGKLMSPNPPRAPRVMLLTTRFSTVLQYSTHDTAEAFRELGWDALALIEPAPSHRLYKHTFRRALADFKPDLVFQIDHLRYEHPGLFPANLPFACWVQDHLPHLKTQRSAASVTPNDFVLTDAGPVYAATFGYPRRQIVGLSKLTRVPATPVAGELGGDDIVFVSNASHVPHEALRARSMEYDGTDSGRALLSAAGARLIDVYQAGGFVSTWFELLTLVNTVQSEMRLIMTRAEVESLAAWLFHPLNDALYRQQALAWAADAADRMGLRLALHGNGWNDHPRFARYAKGPVNYGIDLEQLTRRSAINLQIVPYLCLHQRLLDGLVAGGFYLIRRHPADTQVGALLDFLHAHVGPAGCNAPRARAAISTPYRDELDGLIAACKPAIATTDNDDPVEIALHWEQMCTLRRGEPVLPAYDETSFSDAAGLEQRFGRFLGDAGARDAIRHRQRASVAERFSYVAGVGRVVGQIAQRVSENASVARIPEREAA